MKSRLTMRVLFAGAIVALIAGAGVVAFAALPEPASFGWTAYAPLPGTVFISPGAHPFTNTQLAGFALLVVGLVAFAFWAGVVVGRRSPRPSPDSSPASDRA
jgi:heme/copper-type cytochrome/quinol oxidase subunit 1